MADAEKQLQILIIEDEDDFVMGLKDAFEFEGFQTFSAATGEEGIAAAADIHPDLIILDSKLPKLNGYEICRKIRRLQNDNDVVIFMLISKKKEITEIESQDVGIQKYFLKPIGS